PTTAPGDTLNLALATAQNYVINGSPASGNVTSDNRQMLNWTGFETGPIVDDAAPVVVGRYFDGDGAADQLTFQFSEDLGAISAGSLGFIDELTGEAVSVSLSYSAATFTAAFTFPALPDGQLPSGVYLATFAAGAFTDLAGNALAAAHDFSFIAVAAGGTLALPDEQTLAIDQLGLGAGGQLDLRNGSLAIREGDVGAWDGSAYTGITGQIQSGRNGGTWDGSGIITSMSAAREPNALTTLAVAEASFVLGISGSETAMWNGQTVDATTVLIKYTYGGDANLDGKINIDDYGQIDFNVAASGSVFGWFNGDFNMDGKINIDDYGIIDFNVAAQTGTIEGAASVVDTDSGSTPPEEESVDARMSAFASAPVVAPMADGATDDELLAELG
ncbi:MAG: Ig-like domain-containing protein, partial [Tepidisphaeraceae bacterium]